MAGRFNAGDTVVCLVDHPANNNFIMAGDTGDCSRLREWPCLR